MSSATYPPRCPHRVATSVLANLLLFCTAGMSGLTTTTASLHAQELLDYRLVNPASHMQPWPEVEADILMEPPASIRIATKWRTNLKRTRTQEEPVAAPAQQQVPAVPAKQTQTPATMTTQVPIVQDAPIDRTTEVADSSDRAVRQPLAPASEVVSEKPEVLATPAQPEISGPLAQQDSPNNIDCYQPPRLAELSTSIALPAGKLPTDVAAMCAAEIPPTGDARQYGGWPCIEHHWSATCMHHRPLYFEEINAERYGYTVSYVLQPVISAARFFATIPALPYKMAVDHPRDCVYTLGYYRPGSCVPRRCNRPPFSLSGAAVETGVIAGLILLIP